MALKLFLTGCLLTSSLFGYSFNDINCSCETKLKRVAYDVCYSDSKRSPIFSSYMLNKEKVNVVMQRYNTFLVDPDLKSSVRTITSEYNTCGDRGHLSPASVNDWSDITRRQANYLSNIVVQDPELNRWGAWRASEVVSMNIVNKYNDIFEVSGAIYGNDKCNNLNVPSKMYKLIIIDSIKKYVVFLMDNKNISYDKLPSTIIDINTLENKSTIKFNIPIDYSTMTINEIKDFM